MKKEIYEMAYEALLEISNPISYMDKKGYKINGKETIETSNNPEYLKEIANNAIDKILKLEGEEYGNGNG